MTGLVLILILSTMALSASAVATHDPNDINAPANMGMGSEHYLGTDPIGADVFSRLMFGARISLAVGLASVLLGVTAGALLGLFTGYKGGKTDLVVQCFIDAKIAIPRIIPALTLIAIMGASATNVVIALAIGYISSSTRVTRSVVLREKEQVYVDAARAIGASTRRIMLRHVLPNSISPYLVLVSDASPEGQRGVGTGLRESVNQASSSVSPIAMGGVVGAIGMGLGFLGSTSFCWLLLVAALLLHARDTRQGQKARSVSAG